ncbi:MAG TPA: universal stress protein [Gemmatimonadales bacterium]|nr:universal stress protein [Gemmatimonadales bacterium]
MNHSPIVVGVDESDATPRALALAHELGAAFDAPCRLVHAVRSPWTSAPVPDAALAESFEAAMVDAARARIKTALRRQAPKEALRHIDVRLGRTAVELHQAAEEMDAQAIVIGGKRHSTFGRWFGSSTGHGLARLSERPVVVAGPSVGPVKRVLAAVDLSETGTAILGVAQTYASALGAELRAITVIEPLPVTPGATQAVDPDEYYRWAESHVEQELWSHLHRAGTDKVTRIGHPVETLLRELTDWAADLVIVGSHGRNFVMRALLGSVSEELLNQLPTSLLMVPPLRRAGDRVHTPTPQLAGAL